ncbi:hypothetical protein GH714_005534 [Hevea brasiliensis]|uniref:Glyoxalase/fosfomycin resistance/dioxygenase domain-containing protein n=1 Tax=Hevea brasiliensis TaxID=3981 RepID=A0A6A6L0Z2_HEVBR|nr:hypothetical protein GH714_005534 [Hevea brasiliensis]
MGSVGEIEEIEKWVSPAAAKRSMPILSLNHVSFVCKSVPESVRFYEDVLGFVLIKRPSSFNFEGAWLFNYGVGIHLLESDKVPSKKVVEEGGITVDQLFFHDPDGYMVEICNCHVLPVLPLSSCALKLPKPNGNLTSPTYYGNRSWEMACSGVASLMMENLVVDMMDISI